MPTNEQQERTAQALALYERFGKPLEAEHTGEFVAIAPDGRTLLAPTVIRALTDGAASFGRGNFIFKVGEIAAASWKTPRMI